MTEQDALDVIGMIENHWQRRIEGSRQLWTDFLMGQDGELAVKAIAKLAETEGDMPRIKDMREMLGKRVIRAVNTEEPICASDLKQRVVALVVARMKSARLWMKERGLEAYARTTR
jgi:hypothetical protein